MKKIIFISMAALLFVIATLFAGTPNMKEGKWEISMTMEMKNIPFPMPPIKYTQCITKKDIEDNKNTVPTSGDKKNNCKLTDYKVKGNAVNWKTKCDDGREGSGEMTYSGDSYSGTMKMETKDKKGNKSSIDYKIKGKRLGDC